MLALLVQSPAVIEFDDLDDDIKPHSIMKQALTSEYVTDRILGQSKTATVSTRTLFLFSGNNVEPLRDLRRRIITINLQRQEENPTATVYQNNPVQMVRNNRERFVMSFLTIIQAWKKAGCPQEGGLNVVTYDGTWSDYCRYPLIWLGLSTGARLNEALSAKWEQVDRERRVWRILASNAKSKKVRAVPLNDAALDILNQLDTQGEFEHLFINWQTGEPYTTISKVWGRLRIKAGLPHIRIHDLRHQYASFLVNSGRTLYEVQQILGHSDPSVTQRYAHLSTKALQEAANSASVAIRGAMGG